MITIKTPEEIAIMRQGGKILAQIMKELEKEVKPGIATNYLDKVASDLVLKFGGKCSFKGYSGFPNCLCASVNEVIVHGIPSEKILKEGDIISLDLGILYKGFHNDMAITLPVGKVSSEVLRLIETTKKTLQIAIRKIKPGRRFEDISNAIQEYAESKGFNVVKELCGHGIGRNLHEEPQIPNYGKIGTEKIRKKGTGPIIKEGMVFCLEPMLTIGDWHIKRAKDGYGFESKDGSLSAHFEHTIAVKQNGPQVLTKI